MEETIIDRIEKKKVKVFSRSGHITIPKQYVGEEVYILYTKKITRPKVHHEEEKESDGKTYVRAEVTDGAGTHALWLEKDRIPKIFTRE